MEDRLDFYRCCPIEQEEKGGNKYGRFDIETDTLTITQDKNINLLEYVIIIDPRRYKIINNVYVEKDGKWDEVKLTPFRGDQEDLVFRIIVDFRDRADKIRLGFKNNLADDYIINLKYIEADKEAYYAEQEKKRKENLLTAASIKHATGKDLVNIYFQPCCDDYDRTEIILYHDGQMLAKYNVDKEVFFKSIGGLAYGKYEYIVKQYDKADKLLLETQKIAFSISGGEPAFYGGVPQITW